MFNRITPAIYQYMPPSYHLCGKGTLPAHRVRKKLKKSLLSGLKRRTSRTIKAEYEPSRARV